jgi:Ala-tRNA(Pro) deacylase
MRVPQFLADHEVPFETVVHPPAYTSQKLAHWLHVPGQQLAKCVLLAGPSDYVLAVLPAPYQVDLAAVAAALGGPVRLARPEEVADVFRDCEWGALSPFGALYALRTLLDETIDPDSPIVFQAHRHACTIRMRCRDFERLEKPRRCHISARPATTAHETRKDQL